MKPIFSLSILILFSLISPVAESQGMDKIIKSSAHPEAFWSVTIRDQRGNILEQLNGDKLIIPASNQKLYTTGAALHYLGQDYTYQTILQSTGKVENGVLKGDVIVRGSGDPSISGDLYEEDRYHVFKRFYDQLAEKGIKSIDGDLIGDVSFFDDEIYPVGWDWYDLSFYYGVEIAALSFNNNAVDLIVKANSVIGGKPEISWFPDNTGYVQFRNEQSITKADSDYDEYYRRDPGTNTITLRSTLPQGYTETESLSIHDAGLYFVSSLKEYLYSRGIKLNGTIRTERSATEYLGSDTIATHYSKPLSDLVSWANKESDNFYTEMMLKTLDAELNKSPGSFEGGINLVRSYLSELGLDSSLVIMRDGSGLAFGNLTSTSALSKYLSAINNEPFSRTFEKSLPVAGIDGTIAYRMKNSALYRNFTGKTGYMSGVRVLSGYLECSSGQNVTVSIAANNFAGKVRSVDRIQEEILLYVYNQF